MYIIIQKPKPLDPKLNIKALKRFEWLISFLICRFKFVHQILGMMRKIPSMAIPTMGVKVTPDGKFDLLYNPEFVETLTDAEATYVFYHEILHLVLHHCTRRKLDIPEIANMAYDLAVNELIPEISDACMRPRNKEGELVGCFVSELKKNPMFSDIEERQTAEWYYDYLRKKMSSAGKSGGKGESQGEGGKEFDDHSGWEEHEVADERVKAKIKEIDQNELWGTLTQTDRETILVAQIKRINWRNKIRTWFGNQAWKNKITTRKRPNRRTGFMHPGYKRSYVSRWLIAADTSGSIDSDLLGEWIAVLNQLAEELPIDFMQFDCEKTEDPWPYERRRLKLDFKGRGGTDFQPVMDIVDKRRYKGVMILTDGCAGEPTRPKRAKVLWVLPSGCNPPVEWGEKIHMQRHT